MDLSIIIPSRNEEFLARTIDNILANAAGDTEIIAVLDGYWPDPGIADNRRVTLIHNSNAIGQRAAVNQGVRASRAKFIMKCDAHCMFAPGFDNKLMADCEPDWTVVPRMYNIHAFDWICRECGARTYQGPAECAECKSKNVYKEIIWKKKRNHSDYMWFDTDLRFQYFDNNALRQYANGDSVACKRKYSHRHRPWAAGDITDQMTCLGACWFLHRGRYWELGGMDEGHGGWGQMGVEVACKSWLSGGRQVVNKKTWFAHLFRTQKEFSFPYPLSGGAIDRARRYSRHLWLNDKWSGARRPLRWLIDHFAPLPGWCRT